MEISNDGDTLGVAAGIEPADKPSGLPAPILTPPPRVWPPHSKYSKPAYTWDEDGFEVIDVDKTRLQCKDCEEWYSIFEMRRVGVGPKGQNLGWCSFCASGVPLAEKTCNEEMGV